MELTQIIMPKPVEIGYAHSLPMQISAIFTISVGDEAIRGMYSGTLSPMLDESGNGEAHAQATGQIFSVTAGFIDLFLNYVFVSDVIKMVEGNGTGATGTMQLKPGV